MCKWVIILISVNFIVKNNLTAFVITLLFLFNLCILLPDFQITTIETPYPVKDEEENAMHNTVVIFSSNDSFTLKQVFYLFNTYMCC